MPPRPTQRATVVAARFKTDFPDVDPLAKEISARLVQLVSLFEQDNRPLFDYHQVNRGLFSALVCLRLSGEPYELRHREMTEQMLLSSGGVTNLCRRLKTLGLLESRAEPEDGRGVIFRLTEAGVTLAEQLLPEQHRLECQLVSTLDVDEKIQLCQLLEKLTRHYDP